MRLDDGHSTKISFSLNANVAFWEKEVTPPGVDGGGANDVTNMRNNEWRTMSPKKLKTMTEGGAVVSYDPATITGDVVAMVNQNQQVTWTFADGSKLTIWGWLNQFKPGQSKEGEAPTATVQILASNHDNANPPAEVGPSFVEAP